MISCLGERWLPTATSVSSCGLPGNRKGEEQHCLLAATLASVSLDWNCAVQTGCNQN